MKILLINNNPVVSRLTALSARKEDIEIDEIQEVTELSSDNYDIVFVDSDSLTKDVHDVISENIKAQKSVLFYAEGDEEEKELFDLTILKPFLPSEVSSVIRSVEEMSETSSESEEESHFDILADSKESNREELFTLDDLEEKEIPSSLTESKKEEVAEELFTDLLKDESKEEDSFDAKLEEAFPLKINSLDDDLFDDTLEESKERKKSDEELFELDLDDNKLSLDDELFTEDKDDKSSDELLNLDLGSDEILLENPVEVSQEDVTPEIKSDKFSSFGDGENEVEETTLSTKILDENEIENIKGLLSEDTSNDMVLEDLMPPMSAAVENSIEEPKKSKKKEKESLNLDNNVLMESLTSMPVESLRELLAGAKVKITIKFPKAK